MEENNIRRNRSIPDFISSVINDINNITSNVYVGEQHIDRSSNMNIPRMNNFSALLESVIYSEQNFYDNLEEQQLNAAIQESMDMYKTQERKPDVILDLGFENFVKTEHDEDNKCTICLELFKTNEKISTTNCKHKFHYECILEWGKYKNECPLCKKEIKIKKSNLENENDNMEDKISVIMRQTDCTRERAIEALNNNDNVLDAILDIRK